MGRIVQFYKHVEPLFHPSSIWTHTADHGKDYIKSQSWRIYDLAIIRLSSRFKQQKLGQQELPERMDWFSNPPTYWNITETHQTTSSRWADRAILFPVSVWTPQAP